MSGTLSIDTLQNGAGASVPVTTVINGSAKAWVNANGVDLTIRGSFNVSSITRVSQGVYDIFFTTNMPDANYAIAQCTADGSNSSAPGLVAITSGGFDASLSFYSANGFRIGRSGGEHILVSVSVFR